jgi:tetratricopeptide (TPR) repeat protein
VAVLYRTNPFRILGLSTGADAQTVRNAYRQRVKACHPDRFADPEQQKKAQEQLVELNLAYEEALKQASQRRVGFNQIPLGEAKHFAKRLMEQGNLQSALCQLDRTVERDHEWFYLHGSIMMGLRRYEEAHASFREAIKDEPDNREYRAQALEAALAMKNCHKLDFKVKAWFQDTFKKR